ncbi:MAG: Crp/Fnr family transcriptional regulator [Bacteroidota bacterium]
MTFDREYLRRHLPLWQDQRLYDDLLEHAQLIQLPAGQTILRNEQPIDFVPLVTKGGLKVRRETLQGQQLFLYFVQAGETCTMTLSSCMKRQKSLVRAETLIATEIVLLPLERVFYYTRHFPSWNEFVLNSYEARFEFMVNSLVHRAFDSLEDRLLDYLCNLSQLLKSQDLAITHAQLAEELASVRVVISRLLKNLEGRGQLRLSRGQISLIGQC